MMRAYRYKTISLDIVRAGIVRDIRVIDKVYCSLILNPYKVTQVVMWVHSVTHMISKVYILDGIYM